MKLYHTSKERIESCTIDFSREGDGKSVYGKGLYVSLDKSYCDNFNKENFNKKGILHSIDIDDNKIKFLDAYDVKPEVYKHFYQQVYDLTGVDIISTLKKKDIYHRVESAFNNFCSVFPNQDIQNDLLKQMGYNSIKSYDNFCIIDENILPDTWQYGEQSGSQLKGARYYLNNGNYRSEDLDIAYHYIKGKDSDLEKSIKQACHILLSDKNTEEGSYDADISFSLRKSLGLMVQHVHNRNYDNYKKSVKVFKENLINSNLTPSEKIGLGKILSNIDLTVMFYKNNYDTLLKNGPAFSFKDLTEKVLKNDADKKYCLSVFDELLGKISFEDTVSAYNAISKQFSHTYNADNMLAICESIDKSLQGVEFKEHLMMLPEGKSLMTHLYPTLKTIQDINVKNSCNHIFKEGGV